MYPSHPTRRQWLTSALAGLFGWCCVGGRATNVAASEQTAVPTVVPSRPASCQDPTLLSIMFDDQGRVIQTVHTLPNPPFTVIYDSSLDK